MPALLTGALDLLTLALLASALLPALRRLLADAPPPGPTRGGAQGRLAALATLAGVLLYLWLVGVHLVGRVPGTHCGAGVLDAMGAAGGRAAWLRALALLAACAWWDAQRNDASGDIPARLLLVWTPLAALGAFDTFRAFRALHGLAPHHTCGLVLPAVAPPPLAIAHIVALGAALLLGAAWIGLRPPRRWHLPLIAAALALLWVQGALLLPDLSSPGRHLCAWCLLGAPHRHVGFLLWAVLAIAALSGLAPLWIGWTAQRLEHASARVVARNRLAALTLAGSVLAFGGLWALLIGATPT